MRNLEGFPVGIAGKSSDVQGELSFYYIYLDTILLFATIDSCPLPSFVRLSRSQRVTSMNHIGRVSWACTSPCSPVLLRYTMARKSRTNISFWKKARQQSKIWGGDTMTGSNPMRQHTGTTAKHGDCRGHHGAAGHTKVRLACRLEQDCGGQWPHHRFPVCPL